MGALRPGRLLLALALSLPLRARGAAEGQLTVVISGLRSTEGQVILALFDAEDGYPLELNKATLLRRVPIAGSTTVTVTFDGVRPGRYAAAAIHDENLNNTLDTSWIGLPREGVASSNGAHGHFGPPAFDDAAFEVDAAPAPLPLKMAYL